ncbi:MAG: photosynthetic complex assembly protein PuhC [Hyphomicrobium sp.]|nr:photosynthetic complex assembly protein PuhC [Hyphomicrobium sp.]
MAEHVATEPFPKSALYAAGALIAASIALAMAAKLFDIGSTRIAFAPATQVMPLKFEDLPDGSIGIRHGASGDSIATLAPGQNGFVRVVMRGLARDRMLAGIGSETPVELVALEDGRYVLRDPTTDRVVTLDAFGHENEAAFVALFEKGKKLP